MKINSYNRIMNTTDRQPNYIVTTYNRDREVISKEEVFWEFCDKEVYRLIPNMVTSAYVVAIRIEKPTVR